MAEKDKVTADTPGVQALIDAAVEKAAKKSEDALSAAAAEKAALETQLAELAETWKGLDPQAVKTIMARLETDEEAKLLAEGKMDEVLSRRTERLKADHGRQVAALEAKLADGEKHLDAARDTVKKLTVDGRLRQAAAELKLVPSAIDDALYRAMHVFSLDDDGNLRAEENGATVFGKDGKSPITPAEWLGDMREKAPHWFPTSTGAGATGGHGKAGDAPHSITREQARDVRAYRNARAAAEKAGVPLQIVS